MPAAVEAVIVRLKKDRPSLPQLILFSPGHPWPTRTPTASTLWWCVDGL